MLDPICIKKAKPGQNAIPKTIIRFCKGDPILITGDVGGNIDVFRINRKFDIILGDEEYNESIDQRNRLA